MRVCNFFPGLMIDGVDIACQNVDLKAIYLRGREEPKYRATEQDVVILKQEMGARGY